MAKKTMKARQGANSTTMSLSKLSSSHKPQKVSRSGTQNLLNQSKSMQMSKTGGGASGVTVANDSLIKRKGSFTPSI